MDLSEIEKPIMCYTDLPAPMKRQRGELVAQAKILRREGKMTRIRVKDIDVILEFRDRSSRGPWETIKSVTHKTIWCAFIFLNRLIK